MKASNVIGTTILSFVVWVACQSCYDAITAKHHTKVPETPKAETKAEGKAEAHGITADDLTPLYIELTKATVSSGHVYALGDRYSLYLYNASKYSINTVKIQIELKDGRKHQYDAKGECKPSSDCQLVILDARVIPFMSWDIISVYATNDPWERAPTKVNYIDIVSAYHSKHKKDAIDAPKIDIDALLNQSKSKPEPPKPAPKPTHATSVTFADVKSFLPDLDDAHIEYKPNGFIVHWYNSTNYYIDFKVVVTADNGTPTEYPTYIQCGPHKQCNMWFQTSKDLSTNIDWDFSKMTVSRNSKDKDTSFYAIKVGDTWQ